MQYDIEAVKERLRDRLKPHHYEHSLRTAEAAEEMARTFGADEKKAYLSGLLHDYAKSMSDDALIAESKRFGIDINPVEMAFPYLLHSVVGARLVESELGVKDDEIIRSIENHTIGSVSMTKLDKIIYVADMVEPGRSYKGIDSLRRLALDDLEGVFKEAYAHSLDYLVRSKKLIHPKTVEVWNKLILS